MDNWKVLPSSIDPHPHPHLTHLLTSAAPTQPTKTPSSLIKAAWVELGLIYHLPSCWSVIEKQAGASVNSIEPICSSLYPLLSLVHSI